MSERNTETPGAAREQGRGRLWRWGIALVLGPVLFGVGFLFLLNTCAARDEKGKARNPDTGILVGAEERWLGPEDASGAVLFVHGFVGGGNNFADMPELLAQQGWRVRVMRLPGHGTTPRDFASVSPEALLQAVRDEVLPLRDKYAQLAVVGHSMGGALSTIVASEIPVDKLVLAAPYFGVTFRRWYVLPPETWVRGAAPMLPWLYKGKVFLQLNRREVADQVFSYTWVPMKGVVTLMELGRRAKDPNVLEKITCPVMLLHGQGDVAASPEEARKAFDAMASEDKVWVNLPNSNHHVFWDYDHEEVKKRIGEFLGTPAK